MMSPEEIAQLAPAERMRFRSPFPTRSVSSDEFAPLPQTPRQREFEGRLTWMGRCLAPRHSLSRRRLCQGAAGMAASFLVMNDAFGPLFGVNRAEAQTSELANARAAALKGQFLTVHAMGGLKPRTEPAHAGSSF
jgi:hypothetical protein